MTKDITIGGKKYELKKWGAIDALNMQVKVTKLLASALGGLDNIKKKDIENIMNMDVSNLVSVLAEAVDKIDEVKFTELLQMLLSKNISKKMTDGKDEYSIPLKIDDLELLEIYELSIEVVKFNLGKFISDIQSKFNSRSVSQKTDK